MQRETRFDHTPRRTMMQALTTALALAGCGASEDPQLARSEQALDLYDAGPMVTASEQATNEYGACCALQTCTLGGSVECTGSGGRFVQALSCDDGNGDGLADACAHGSCSDEGPVSCTLEGTRLRVVVAGRALDLHGAFHQVLEGDAPIPGRYVAEQGAIAIDTPQGAIALPQGSTLSVRCDPYLAISGELSGMPIFDGVAPLSGLGLDSNAPTLSLGFARGEDLRSLELPLADCQPYLFLAVKGAVSVALGDARLATQGEALELVLDPWDPAFVFELESSALASSTGLPIGRIGLGLSDQGALSWRSASELPVRLGSSDQAAMTMQGHVYQRGQVNLIPVKTPLQVKLDGTLFADLGDYPEAAQALSSVLFRGGDLHDLDEALEESGLSLDAEQLLDETSFAANVNSLSVHHDLFDVTVGRGALMRQDGLLRFSGEAQSLGSAFTARGDSSLADSLAAITVRSTERVSGIIDYRAGDRYRFELEGALQVGPFALDHARLIVDSEQGVKVDAGFDVDLLGFVQSLEQLLDCDYDVDGGACKLAGYEVTSLRTALDANGAQVFLKLDMFGFYDGEFVAQVGRDGRFAVAAIIDRLPGSGPPPLTASGGRLEVRSDGVSFQGRYASFDLSTELSGFVRADAARRRASFSFTGTGQKAFIPGAPPFTTTLTIANIDEQAQPIDVRAQVRVAVDPSLLTNLIRVNDGRPFAELLGDLRVDGGVVKYQLTGQANLTVLDFEVVAAQLSLGNQTGAPRLFVDAPMRLPAGLLDTRLRGEIERNRFSFVSSADARVPMVAGYALTGTARLDPNGLFVDGQLSFGAGVARGTVQFDRRFQARFSGSVVGQAGIPPHVLLDGSVLVDGSFGPPERNPYLRIAASGGVRVKGVRLQTAGATAYTFIRSGGVSVSGSLETAVTRIDMSGEVMGDQIELRGRGAFDIPITSSVTAVTSEVISGTRSGWECTRTSVSCGYNYAEKWVDSIGDCFDSFRMRCKKKVLGTCVLYLPYCRVRVPKGNCNECTLRRDYPEVSLGSLRGEVALSLQNRSPALSGSASVSGTFCRGSQCKQTPTLSSSVDTSALRVCVRIPGSSIAEEAQSALGIPREFRVSAEDKNVCGPF